MQRSNLPPSLICDSRRESIKKMDAITSFRQVSDHNNMIMNYRHLGFTSQSLAEKMVPIEPLSSDKRSIHYQAYVKKLETAKHQYLQSLKHYATAKMEVSAIVDIGDEVEESVNLELAHVFLKLGILLGREDTKAEVDDSCFVINKKLGRKVGRKHEVSAQDAIREAISIYESMGEQLREEAAYGYMELTKYHWNCCLDSLESLGTETMPKSVNNIIEKRTHERMHEKRLKNIIEKYMQKLEQEMSLADMNWEKSIKLYGDNLRPIMHMSMITDKTAFYIRVSDTLCSAGVLDGAFIRLREAIDTLLEARLMSAEELTEQKGINDENASICSNFWTQLQSVSKNMCSLALEINKSSSSSSSQQSSSSKDSVGLIELYRKILGSSQFAELVEIYSILISLH